MSADSRAHAVAREVYGWESLRPAQQQGIQALLAGRDVLAVMPTGAGKSAIYQVPAVLLPGPTVVVSPLRALQRDQATSVRSAGESAEQVDSTLSASARRRALAGISGGRVEFVFVTPEQLADEAVVAAVAAGSPSLVAVDEAHCVSAWGHDFRPEYRHLGRALAALGRPPVVALTATAAPPVRADIADALGLRDPLVLVQGLDRPNIDLEVRTLADEAQRNRALTGAIEGLPCPGIVYVPTRRATVQVAEALGGLRRARPYHGGMRAAERSAAQDLFMSGGVEVMVATSAFGMGIDKADVRFVVHATTPDSPDSYLQELGRAGRDGTQAWSLLLHRPEDLALRRFLIGGTPGTDLLREVAAAVAGAGSASRADLAAATGRSRPTLARALALLERVGAVRTGRRGRVAPGTVDPDEGARLAHEEALRHRRVVRSRLDMMREYVATTQCRRQFLMGYFGQRWGPPCGSCDTCRAGGGAPTDPTEAGDGTVAPHARVSHPRWAHGTVMHLSPDSVTVYFDSVGYRTLSREVVDSRGLLAPVEPLHDKDELR